MPGPGEAGYETWSGDSWLHGGAPIWVTGSYDPETNLTFWGTGNPGPDWNGDGRVGDNLYSCSVIAVDADTGKLKWHYQFSPHNEFDWDSTQVPVLADIDFQGTPRKVMMWANRNGVFYVLDRTNGEFLSGQPFVKMNWDTASTTRAGRFPARNGPDKGRDPDLPRQPGRHQLVQPVVQPAHRLVLHPGVGEQFHHLPEGRTPPEFRDGQGFTGTGPGRAPTDDVHSSIRDRPNTGIERRRCRLSAPTTETGMLTTASNILFAADVTDRSMRSTRATAKLLWQTNLGPSVSASPMTYTVDGKQYVSVMAGTPSTRSVFVNGKVHGEHRKVLRARCFRPGHL